MATKGVSGPAEYDWDSFARAAGSAVGDMFAGPSAADPHVAESNAHTQQQDASGGFSLFSVLANPFQALGDVGRAVQQEGLGALGDLGDAMDRQDAQRDLASRFNVGLGDGIQPMGTGENDVTQEEFLAIARQYSDIRRGNSNLKMNFAEEGSDAKDIPRLENQTMQDIADIMQTQVGRELIGNLASGRRETMISESSVTEANGGSYYMETDSGAKRWFNHAQYAPGQTHFPGEGDYRSDATLFHELTHAYQSAQGAFATGSVDSYAPGDGGEIDRSEYQAVGLGDFASERYTENAYRDARSRMTSGNRTLGGSDQQMEARERYTHD